MSRAGDFVNLLVIHENFVEVHVGSVVNGVVSGFVERISKGPAIYCFNSQTNDGVDVGCWLLNCDGLVVLNWSLVLADDGEELEGLAFRFSLRQEEPEKQS